MLIDTHCHLNDKMFYDDFNLVLSNAKEDKVGYFVIPGADPRELELAIKLSEENPEVFFAVGIHPYDLEYGEVTDLKKFIKHHKCVAVGECGLDYFRLPEVGKTEYKEYQKEKFIQQIELALEYQKPLILHIREASSDAYEILSKYPDAKGVFHCFNADSILLKLSSQFYYGIGGVCTFKNAKRLIEILPMIPQDRLVLETDSPYLTPSPYRGQRNEPKFVKLVAEQVAGILNLSLQEIEKITTQNAEKIFKFR